MIDPRRRSIVMGTLLLASFGCIVQAGAADHATAPASPPAVGDTVRDFTLTRVDGKPITLSALTKDGPVVMILLRGWVGYQCPICNRQVGGFLSEAEAFQAQGASVVLVYPGAAYLVQQKAEEFITGKSLPDRFHFVIDPDLKVVNLYGLRWDAPQETAYPSTFVFDRQGIVRFAKISHSHGDRSSAPEVLSVLQGLK
jgi:peroxiredoxin